MKKSMTLIITILITLGLNSFVFAADSSSLETAILAAVDDCKTELDVSNYDVEPEAALKTYFALYNTDPDFTYASNNAQCEYSGGKAKKLYFSYKGSSDEIKNKKAAVENEVNKIVAEANKADNDVDKIKIVHDYIAGNTSYMLCADNSSPYELLVNKRGTCLAYSFSFKLIMDRLNIPCELATSTEMCHAWDVVKVNDNWYNIDLTYDATSCSQLHSMSYANSLKSDSYFKSAGYTSWTVDNSVNCADTSFDGIM